MQFDKVLNLSSFCLSFKSLKGFTVPLTSHFTFAIEHLCSHNTTVHVSVLAFHNSFSETAILLRE